jgi:UDP-glucose 4-epimerase
MSILVTGGAGYIGSHMVRMLVAAGQNVIVIDSLEYGHPEALPPEAHLVIGNVGDPKLLEDVFAQNPIESVIHFASYISVPESVDQPEKYLQNNFLSPIKLLQTMVNHSVKHLIFSSTAAVYGIPQDVPIPETHPKSPINPYGLSKLAFEQALTYFDRQFNLKSIALRYFNACGATPDGQFGEDHHPEGHLIPLIIRSALNNTAATINGNDYSTKDGTCIRDYIHIEDLCTAHLLALDALKNGHSSDVFNVGTGVGRSNLEVVNTIKQASGVDFPLTYGPRRPGDPDELVADSQKLQKRLGWTPHWSDLVTIVSHALTWHRSHPAGYTQSK